MIHPHLIIFMSCTYGCIMIIGAGSQRAGACTLREDVKCIVLCHMYSLLGCQRSAVAQNQVYSTAQFYTAAHGGILTYKVCAFWQLDIAILHRRICGEASHGMSVGIDIADGGNVIPLGIEGEAVVDRSIEVVRVCAPFVGIPPCKLVASPKRYVWLWNGSAAEQMQCIHYAAAVGLERNGA